MTVDTPRKLTVALRKPPWAGEGFAVRVNGEEIPGDVVDPYSGVPESGRPVAGRPGLERAGTYVELTRIWKTGDTIEVVLPKTLRLEPTPDDPTVTAVMWGPLALAADLGPELGRGRGEESEADPRVIPVFVAAGRPVEEWVKPVSGETGHFRISEVGRDSLGAGIEVAVDLVPFYRLHRRTYGIYFDLFTESGWEERKAEYIAEQERLLNLEKATVAYAQPGEMQPERDFNFQGSEDSRVTRLEGRAGRRSGDWMSFDLPVSPEHPMALVVTYNGSAPRRSRAEFDILVDGEVVGREEVSESSPGRFFDVEYAVPAQIVKGKKKVTVRFQSTEGNSIATVFGVRMIRADAKR